MPVARFGTATVAAQLIFHPEPLLVGAPIPDSRLAAADRARCWSASRGTASSRERELHAGDRTFVLSGRLRADTRTRRPADRRRHRTGAPVLLRATVQRRRGARDTRPAHRDRGRRPGSAGEREGRSGGARPLHRAHRRRQRSASSPLPRRCSCSPARNRATRRHGSSSCRCAPSSRTSSVRRPTSRSTAHPASASLADPDLLRQAVATLVDNARRHARDGIAIAVAEADGTVSIDILDTGSGILPEHLERVTERFYSAAGRDSGGYGIGLSIAARAARVLGGTLDLASSRSGTRARLRLPSARLLS